MAPEDLNQGRDSLRDLLLWGKEELSGLGQRESLSNAEWLLAYVTGRKKSDFYTDPAEIVSEKEKQKYQELIRRRSEGMPAAYLTGQVYFWDEILNIGPGCLIPRPETELLIEKFIEQSSFKKEDRFSFLDIGTGSGAIAIALLGYFPNACAVAVDVSDKALDVARKNIEKYRLQKRIELIQSDLFLNIKGRQWDVIVSNPPYIVQAEIPNLQEEVRREPVLALDGGEDGLVFYRRILEEASLHLKAGGTIFLELGAGQAAQVMELLQHKGFKAIKIFNDYAGIERVIMANR
ncbi:MAG: peptide chain release factor N(5)-glutamine methyltransferase [Candidatus Omnitrophica bacterium]|nr:peptide chain release factor N(5)-glutamine methyltransferase [Candidatus Omnitrophota bacterium]